MKRTLFLLLIIIVYVLFMGPFTRYMAEKPIVEKLGYIPRPEVLRVMAADHKVSVASLMVLKTLIYFGSLTEHKTNELVTIPPDYYGMYNALTTALKLDPYNMDAYYFSQAFLVWDLGRIREANAMLVYGMKYRTWDWYLPFFAGFNYAYFLKDYSKAAEYFKRVGDLTGSELSINLTGRYLYESGQTGLAISYLSAMEKGVNNAAVKRSFSMRLDAFKKVRHIEMARDRFVKDLKRLPTSIGELVERRYLDSVPLDPYGGSFFLDGKGQVRSTSNFAIGWKAKGKSAEKTGDKH